MYLEAYAVVRYSRANSICTDLYGRNVHALYEYVRVMSRIQNSELRRICGQVRYLIAKGEITIAKGSPYRRYVSRNTR